MNTAGTWDPWAGAMGRSEEGPQVVVRVSLSPSLASAHKNEGWVALMTACLGDSPW